MRNAQRSPRRTASTASALMVGVALVAFFTLYLGSVSSAVAGGGAVTADRVVSSATLPARPVPDRLAADLTAADGVSAVTIRTALAQVGGEPVFVGALDADPEGFYDLRLSEESLGVLAGGGVAVAAEVAADLGPGDSVTLTTAAGDRTLPVVAQFERRLPGFYGPTYLVSPETLAEVAPEASVLAVLLDVAGGTDGIEALVDGVPTTALLTAQEFADQTVGTLGDFLSLAYVLLAAAVVIALFGIGNTIALAVRERTSELGVLRAVGTTRGQVFGLVLSEAVIVALQGVATGLVLGVGGAKALIDGLGIETLRFPPLPWGRLALLVVLAVVGAFAATLLPARRAARLDPLDAIAAEG